jgi:hypothetical protein
MESVSLVRLLSACALMVGLAGCGSSGGASSDDWSWFPSLAPTTTAVGSFGIQRGGAWHTTAGRRRVRHLASAESPCAEQTAWAPHDEQVLETQEQSFLADLAASRSMTIADEYAGPGGPEGGRRPWPD